MRGLSPLTPKLGPVSAATPAKASGTRDTSVCGLLGNSDRRSAISTALRSSSATSASGPEGREAGLDTDTRWE